LRNHSLTPVFSANEPSSIAIWVELFEVGARPNTAHAR
jgi:hypothetical protein